MSNHSLFEMTSNISQLNPYSFCNKEEPYCLLDTCLLSPHFSSNHSFTSALQKQTIELKDKRGDAVAKNNHQLADSCHNMVTNIKMMETRMGHGVDQNYG